MADKPKNVAVSATIPADLHKSLDDHAWSTRKRLREVIVEALHDYADKHNLTPGASTEGHKPGKDAPQA